MSLFSLRTSATLVATALVLAGCSASDTQEDPSAEETSTASTAEVEGGVSYEPGLASCEFNNELREDEGDRSGVSPFGEMDRVELREEADAYVVTMTGDLLHEEVFAEDGAYSNLQIILSSADHDEQSRYLITEIWDTGISFSGTSFNQDSHDQDTGAALTDGEFTATYPKDSPHLEGFEPAMWAASVSFSTSDEKIRPVGFRCGDGRSWTWEPLA